MLLAFTPKAHWWCLFTSLPVLITRPFFFWSCFIPQPVLVRGLTPSRVQGLSFVRFLPDHYCSLSSSFRIAILPSSALAAPPPAQCHLQICAELLFMLSCHSCNNHIPCQGSFQVKELKELAWIWWTLHKENRGIQDPVIISGGLRQQFSYFSLKWGRVWIMHGLRSLLLTCLVLN